MKTKIGKKLVLTKSTVSNLQDQELSQVMGGYRTQSQKESECYLNCAPTELCTYSCAASCQSINPNCDWTDTCF